VNYNEALEYIHSVVWKGSRPGLSRITELCNLLGNPQRETKYIHVAGTNGKGSTCAMLASILKKAGYRVGLFTSPYIERFNERIQFMGENISNEDLSQVTEYVRSFADTMADLPTEFELITAIAFEYYKRVQCNIVILETGMGGRLDSTNIIQSPLLSIITNIGLDHVAYLGDTIEKIAAEKAGIIKKSCPVLFGGNDEVSSKVIQDTARAKGSEFYEVDYSKLKVNSANLDGLNFDFGNYKDMNISMIGLYQGQNASLVLSAIDILKANGIQILDQAIREGLEKAIWKGRFEILSREPLFIIDGSHNSHGIHAAAQSIKYYLKDQKVILLSGVMGDKDYTKMTQELTPLVRSVHTLTPNNQRALSSVDYAKAFTQAGALAHSHLTIKEAVESAVMEAKETNSPIIALGSLYMYSDVKQALLEILAI
jgi:dihydrofolate synthase/folylpolyglutamate synthase